MTTAALGFLTRDLIPSSRQTCSSRSSPTCLNPVFRSYLWELTRCCRPLTDRGCSFPSISSKRPSRYHPLRAIRAMTSPNLRLPPKPVGPTGKSSLLLPCLHQWRSLPGVWPCFLFIVMSMPRLRLTHPATGCARATLLFFAYPHCHCIWTRSFVVRKYVRCAMFASCL
jgi:hypothetical protein